MSKIKVNSLEGVGASTPAISIDNASGTCTANITNNLSNRNLIINGAMQVAQRSTSSNLEGYHTVDRFRLGTGGVDEHPTQAQVNIAAGTTPYTLGFRKALKITNGNQTSGAGASDDILIHQKIEAQNIATSGWNYTSSSSFITLSFWVKSSVAQNFYGFLLTADGTAYSYPFETGSLSADTWTKITKTISGNSNLQFDNNNGIGLEVIIGQFFGTDQTGSVSLNAWGAFSSSARTPDFTSTWYTTNDATFELTGVQLEVGSHATDFEHRSFAQELVLCQRYYFQGDGQELGASLNGYYGCMYGSGNAMIKVSFPTTMRAKPTVTTPSSHSGGGTLDSIYENFTEIVYYVTGDDSVSIAPSQVKASAEL
jgi:hypothetical protein|tara:strand:+ start:99 stop:1205 length:1107 start_codon:yes stop_codon:yes gene_type:complete